MNSKIEDRQIEYFFMLTGKLYFEPDSISVLVPWVNIISVSTKTANLCYLELSKVFDVDYIFCK